MQITEQELRRIIESVYRAGLSDGARDAKLEVYADIVKNLEAVRDTIADQPHTRADVHNILAEHIKEDAHG